MKGELQRLKGTSQKKDEVGNPAYHKSNSLRAPAPSESILNPPKPTAAKDKFQELLLKLK
jgi:hypothetical protein